MQFQRISPTQVLVVGPLEIVREGVWYALWQERIASPLVDVERNIVSGTQGDSIVSTQFVVTAHFEVQPEGIVVSFESRPSLGTKDLDAGRRIKKLVSSLERILEAGYPVVQEGKLVFATTPIPEISQRERIGLILTGVPVYGSVLAPKRGVNLLCYGLFGFFCCQLLAPITLLYGVAVLRDYKRHGDPGDKNLVVASMLLSGITILFVSFGLVLLI